MDYSIPEFLIHGVSLSLGTLGRPCSHKNIGAGIHGADLILPAFHPGRLCSLFPGKQLGKGWDPTSLRAGTPPERAGMGAGKEFPAGIQGSFWDRICCADVEDPGSGIWDHSHPSSLRDSPHALPGCSPASQRSQGLRSQHSVRLGAGSPSLAPAPAPDQIPAGIHGIKP